MQQDRCFFLKFSEPKDEKLLTQISIEFFLVYTLRGEVDERWTFSVEMQKSIWT